MSPRPASYAADTAPVLAPTTPTLGQRLVAELVGTALLVATVVGSGIAASRLSPGDVGLQLLENSIATGAVLVTLILLLQPVSAAFNPVVTLAEARLGSLPWRDVGPLVVAQVLGACLGSVVANVMFDLAPVTWSTHERSGSGLWLGELVATFGLLLVVLGIVRSGRERVVAYAVAGWIAAAYWATSSTSFANPAVTVGRALSDTFAGIAPSSVPVFVVVQVLGGSLGLLVARYLFPTPLRQEDAL